MSVAEAPVSNHSEDSSTQAVVLEGDGAPRVRRLDLAPTVNGAVRLRLRLCGLCGTDLHKLAHGGAPAGTVLGHEMVGEVEATSGDAIADGQRPLRPGDRVVVPHHLSCGECEACLDDADPHCPAFRENLLRPGGFADRLIVAPRAVGTILRRVPDAMSDETALFLEPAACVIRSVRAGGVLALGELMAAPRIRVLGAGSVGLLHVAVVRALVPGAWIVAVDPRPERRAAALRFGADAAEDLGVPRPESHVVFDCVGGARALAGALESVRPRGRVVLFAHGGEGESAGFPLNPFFKRELGVLASYSAGRRDLDLSWELLTSRRLQPAELVTHVLPLDRFAEGVDLARRHQALKVAFAPGDGAHRPVPR